jgi:hypothetical protein
LQALEDCGILSAYMGLEDKGIGRGKASEAYDFLPLAQVHLALILPDGENQTGLSPDQAHTFALFIQALLRTLPHGYSIAEVAVRLSSTAAVEVPVEEGVVEEIAEQAAAPDEGSKETFWMPVLRILAGLLEPTKLEQFQSNIFFPKVDGMSVADIISHLAQIGISPTNLREHTKQSGLSDNELKKMQLAALLRRIEGRNVAPSLIQNIQSQLMILFDLDASLEGAPLDQTINAAWDVAAPED